MRQDRIFARILLIFSVANVALTAPAAIVRQRHLDVAKAASEYLKRTPAGSESESESSDYGDSGSNSPPKSPSPNDPIWTWLEGAADSEPPSHASTPEWPEPGSTAENRITPEEDSDWPDSNSPPESLQSEPESESPSPPANRVIPAQGWPKPPSPPGDRIIPAQGEWWPSPFSDTSVSSFLEHPLLPSHQNPAPVLTNAPPAPGANRFISDSLKHKILVSSGVIGVIGGAAALAYGIHQWIKQPYVSPFFPLSPQLPADI